MKTRPKIGKLKLSTKEASASIIEWETETTKFKMTSGIAGQHNDGGTSASRLQRKRQEEVNAFLRKICKKAQELKVDGWTYEGDKGAIKKFQKICPLLNQTRTREETS